MEDRGLLYEYHEPEHGMFILMSVRLWNFKDGGS